MKIKEIFKFVEGANVWNVTSSDTDEVFAGDTYTSTTVKRSESESKNELSRANIEISFSVDSSIAKRWLNTVVDSNVFVTVWTKQDATYLVVWKGRLASVKPSDSTIKLVFESVFTSLRRPGLRARFQRNCRHTLYSQYGCKVDKNAFAVAGSATAALGAVYTVAAAAAYPDGTFVAGMLKAPDGTYRYIVGHAGSSLTLIRPIESLTTAIAGGAQSVIIYPGCDRSRTVCNSRFNNLPNNGSFPFIPQRNPFTGNSFV